MPLNSDIKFQKTLALAASASNSYEAEAAEFAARRLIETYSISPLNIPDVSLYSRDNFANNPLLIKLRVEEQAKITKEPIKRKIPNHTKTAFDHIKFNVDNYDKPIRQQVGNRKIRTDNCYCWTDDKIKILIKLLNQHKTPDEIIKELGLIDVAVNMGFPEGKESIIKAKEIQNSRRFHLREKLKANNDWDYVKAAPKHKWY